MLSRCCEVTASLRQFKDSRFWFACFTGPGGERVQRSTKEIDRRRAQKIADAYEDAARQARLGFLVERQARKVIGEIYEISTRERLRSDSVADFFTRWLERVRVELNHKTFRRYEGVTAEFLNWLGPRAVLSIAHLSSIDIVGYRDYLARKHSPSSVNTSLAAIQSALSRAFDDRLVDTNEASRVPRLKDDPTRKQQRRAFTQRELQAILKVCDPEWRGMVLCGAYTGMRLGDVSALDGRTSIWRAASCTSSRRRRAGADHPYRQAAAPSSHGDRRRRSACTAIPARLCRASTQRSDWRPLESILPADDPSGRRSGP